MIAKPMSTLESKFQKHLDRWKIQVPYVGLRYYQETTQMRVVRNDRPEKNLTFEDHGVMLEVFVNGHWGYYGTSDLSEDGLNRALAGALATTQVSSTLKVFDFDPLTSRPGVSGEYQSSFEKSLNTLSPKEINEYLTAGTRALDVGPQIIDRAASTYLIETDILLLSTTGTRVRQSFQKVSVDLSATSSNGNENQTRSWNGGFARCHQIGAEAFRNLEIEAAGAQIGTQALELLSAPNCPTGTKDIILMPDQMMLQIHESIGHPLELDRILGDERNYAGSSFVRKEDFGNLQYGSKLMNATFDPGVSHEFASYAFDDSGNQAEKKYLIKDGLLVAGLGSLESQARSKLPGVANFRSASWNRAPIDRMSNINLEAGTSELQDLISGIDDGVIMHSNKSWSIDDFRRKFQFTCEYGERIQNGKIVGVVKNPNYRGTTVPFWSRLAGVGTNLENFGTPYCGKGEPSQVIRVGHASPPCLFQQIEVFGGAE